MHIITFLLPRQATSEEAASDGQVSDTDEPGPSTKKNKRKHKKEKPVTKMTEQREVMTASVYCVHIYLTCHSMITAFVILQLRAHILYLFNLSAHECLLFWQAATKAVLDEAGQQTT